MIIGKGVRPVKSTAVRFVQTADAVFLVLLAGLFAQWMIDPSSDFILRNWMMVNIAMLFIAIVGAGAYISVKPMLGSQRTEMHLMAAK